MGDNTKEYLLAVLTLIGIIGLFIFSAMLPAQILNIMLIAIIVIDIVALFISGLLKAIEKDKKEREDK